MAGTVLNLTAIEASLRSLQREFPTINAYLQSRRDRLDDTVVANMLAGYAYIDAVVSAGLDILSYGKLQHLLELNTLVLCGNDAEARRAHAQHVAATEARFWDLPGAGVRDIVQWHDSHHGDSVWERAAGVYVRILSEPQLYIEGNHRTGALIMSYILTRDGQPPFVLTVENAKAYFDPSEVIKMTRKSSITMLYRMPKIKRNFGKFLQRHADASYLMQGGGASAVRAVGDRVKSHSGSA